VIYLKGIKVNNLTLLAETKFLSLVDAEYENKKGTTKHWIIASRKDFKTLKNQYFNEVKEKIDAVVIMALHKELKKLVLIKQFRVPLNDYVYELPAGLVDEDELMEQAVKRELREETGLNLLEIDYNKTKNGVYISAGMTDESVALVYCSCEGTVSNKYLEADEDIETLLISQEEAKEILRETTKMDIKVYMLLQSFSILGEKIFE
jgi:ADP-ribose pyrophosphatase